MLGENIMLCIFVRSHMAFERWTSAMCSSQVLFSVIRIQFRLTVFDTSYLSSQMSRPTASWVFCRGHLIFGRGLDPLFFCCQPGFIPNRYLAISCFRLPKQGESFIVSWAHLCSCSQKMVADCHIVHAKGAVSTLVFLA